jgi:hypothetical protein
MHHPTLCSLLTALGLSACASPAAPPISEPTATGEGEGEGEPSGLGMPGLRTASLAEQGPHFVSEEDEWCSVLIDTRVRSLELAPSYLQAWNLVVEHGRRDFRSFGPAPHTETEARERICGRPGCSLTKPQVIRAGREYEAGLGVLVPTAGGLLVAPVGGGGGGCVLEPTLEVETLGEFVHLRVSASDGDYGGYHVSSEPNGAYGYGLAYAGCESTVRTRTDLVVIPEQERLVLSLTQVAPRDQLRPLVEAALEAEDKVSLEGCNDILELSWTQG